MAALADHHLELWKLLNNIKEQCGVLAGRSVDEVQLEDGGAGEGGNDAECGRGGLQEGCGG